MAGVCSAVQLEIPSASKLQTFKIYIETNPIFVDLFTLILCEKFSLFLKIFFLDFPEILWSDFLAILLWLLTIF